jgi:hypothetical protein
MLWDPGVAPQALNHRPYGAAEKESYWTTRRHRIADAPNSQMETIAGTLAVCEAVERI